MKFKNFISSLFLSFWVVIGLAAVATLVQNHYIVFNPNSKVIERKMNSENSLKLNPELWTLHHVLAPDCGCSKAVYEYLIERKSNSQYNEIVSIIGEQPNWNKFLNQAGFLVQQIKSTDLDQQEMIGVPFLAIQNLKQQVYLGGYGDHFIKKKSDIHDLDIVAQLQGQGKAQNVFPVYGCATSAKYKKILDPFDLKQKNQFDVTTWQGVSQ